MSIITPLFEHQEKSIQCMSDLERTQKISLSPTDFLTTKVGFLSDIGGYGKSLSVLGLIARTLTLEPLVDSPYYHETIRHSDYVQRVSMQQIEPLSCSLILVSVSLLSQWKQELNRTTLRYEIVYSKSEVEYLNFKELDVVVVSHTLYNLFAKIYSKKLWNRFIIDEPASLGIVLEPIHAQFYWLITATPEELIYEHKCRGFLQDLIPEYSNDAIPLIIRNEEQFIKKSFDMPPTEYIRYNCFSIAKYFEEIVNKSVRECLESGNVQMVINMWCGGGGSCSNQTMTIYDAYIHKQIRKIAELREKEQDHEDGGKIQERISEIQMQISSLRSRLPLGGNMVTKCCHNFFFESKTMELCPFCKASPFAYLTFQNYVSCIGAEIKHVDVHKMDMMMKIVTDCLTKKDSKILIFSNQNETFTIIKRFLPPDSFLELKGSKTTRDNTLDAYRTGNTHILLLNTVSAGSGLNLQETTDIIIHHTINEYTNSQVIARALRIGRTKPLRVHYL